MKKLVPPYTMETAKEKVQAAEDAWNSKDPKRIAKAYSKNSKWRNRNFNFQGREAIESFLTSKWERELHYKLKKYLWSFTGNRISVRFIYEWFDERNEQWYRTHGNEHWEFDEEGLMLIRDMSANDIKINESEKKLN